MALDTNVRGVVAYRPVGQMRPSQESRTHLVQTALRLFATRGYHHTSIADITRESGCTRGSLYHYFSSKEELGYAVIDEQLRLLFEEGSASHLQTEGHPVDRLLKTLDALPNVTKLGTIPSSATDVAVQMAAVHEGFRQRLARGLEGAIDQIEEMVRRGVAEGKIADNVDPRHVTHVIVTMGAGIQFAQVLWNRKVIWEDAKRWLQEYLNSLRR